MTMALTSMLLLVCIMQIGSLGGQAIQIFSKILERPSPPNFPTSQTGYPFFNGSPTLVVPRSGDSTPSNGGSGMDPEQYRT
jgi:hypothetical protein